MALFKILRGNFGTSGAGLAAQPFHDGYAYFTPDTGCFYIDVQSDTPLPYYHDVGTENGKTVYRVELESQVWSELVATKTDVGHKHNVSDINGIGDLTFTGGTTSYVYDGTADLTLDLRADWNESNANSIGYIKNKPTIINVGITMDRDAKTMFITSPIENGDGVSY